MKTIIRIEHPEDGWGIFAERVAGKPIELRGNINSTFSYEVKSIGKVLSKHDKMRDAKWINGFKTGKYYCAYPSVESMKKWINYEEIRQLLALGFVVLLLDVTEYIEDEDQIVYTKESIVSSKDISSLFL